jgi:hypothetical protein
VTTKISEIGRVLTRSPTTGREPISEDRSNHRGARGGSEELNVPAEPEQEQGKKRSRMVYHM